MFLIKVGTSVIVPLGPAVSATDGIAFTTGLAGTGAGKLESTSSGVHLIKNGGAAAVRHATAAASTEDALSKSYLVTLDGTDTATVGTLRVGFNVAGTLDMQTNCMVLPAKIYDSIVGGTDNLEVDVIQLLGTAWLTPATAGTPDVNLKTILSTLDFSTTMKAGLATAPIRKNTALAKFSFVMISSSTGLPVGGKTVTCTRSIDDGAFGAGTLTNVAEQAGAVGVYCVDFGASDLNGTVIVLRATATGCKDTFVTLVPWA
jgi:hypothetical protein